MTILHLQGTASNDIFHVEADADDVQEAVWELEEAYDGLPDDEQGDKDQFVLNGLEEKGFDVWNCDVVTVQC